MRWSNVPVPEPHVAALIGGAVLHAILPLRIPMPTGPGRILGIPMIAAGAGLAAWAVISAGNLNVADDEALVTTGAYGVSRNPMYVGWSAAVLGVALATGSSWLLGAWVIAVRALDREIDVEELRLLRRFGPTYATYRDQVPRYVGTGRAALSSEHLRPASG